MIRIVMAILLSALAVPTMGQTAAQNTDKLGAGDTVHITVFQQPDMTTDARVTDRGTVQVPLVGSVKVNVALTTLRSRQVSVLGLVVRPGLYPLDSADMRVPQVIAAAGGIAPGGSETVTIIRSGKPIPVNSLSKDFELKGGDTVYVDR